MPTRIHSAHKRVMLLVLALTLKLLRNVSLGRQHVASRELSPLIDSRPWACSASDGSKSLPAACARRIGWRAAAIFASGPALRLLLLLQLQLRMLLS